MKKFIIGSLLAMLAINAPTYAQQVTAGRTSTGRIQTIKVGEDGTLAIGGSKVTSTVAGGTITTAGTYQTVLAANAARQGCFIQNTSSATMKFFLGPPGSASDATSLIVVAGGTFSCLGAGGLVLTDQISATATASLATFVVVSQ